MKSKIIIESSQNNQKNDIVIKECDFVETQNNYIISYLEDLYNNIISVDKNNNIVTVDKKSVGSKENYHSKLIFEFQKCKKCSINTTEYSFFVDINTIKIDVLKENDNLIINLKYYINDAYNEVKIKVKNINE